MTLWISKSAVNVTCPVEYAQDSYSRFDGHVENQVVFKFINAPSSNTCKLAVSDSLPSHAYAWIVRDHIKCLYRRVIEPKRCIRITLSDVDSVTDKLYLSNLV